MSHLYEELAKRKALVEQVKKLQSEVDQLDSTVTVPEKSTPSSVPSARASSSINTKSTGQSTKTVTSPSSTSSVPAVVHGKPLVSLVTPGFTSSPSVISKPSAVISVSSGTLGSSRQQNYSTAQPLLVNTYQPMLRPSVGIPVQSAVGVPVQSAVGVPVQSAVGMPVQMVSYIDKDGKVITTASTLKTKPTRQKGNAKKKPRVSQQSKPSVNATLPSTPAALHPQAASTVASQTTPTGSVLQSPRVSHPYQPLITSPVTPVIASARPGSGLVSSVSIVTSPVTPTPLRQVPGGLSSVVPLSVPSAPSSASQRSCNEVPTMVSFAQHGLSYISPLSPLSTMSAAPRPPTSAATPLSSLSASTEKYLNTFTTQSAAAPRPSFSSTLRSPPVSTSQLSYSGRTSFLNTDLSTDHSAGIKLLCDLLNDTLPEQPPPLVATSLALRSLGTPTSLASSSSIPDSSRVEQRRHTDTTPTPPHKTASKSPRTPPLGNSRTSRQSPGCAASSMEQTASAQRTPTIAGTAQANRKRTSPFTIESLVSSSPESQQGKSKSPDEVEAGKRHPSPASSTDRSSPKGKNKSPSTNFSIAHITRDINSANSASIGRVPFVTEPATNAVPTSVSSGEMIQQHRRVSPPLPRISNPDTESSLVDSNNMSSSSAAQSSMGSDSHSVSTTGAAATGVEMQRQRVSAPEPRVCGPPADTNCQVQSSVVSNEVSRSYAPNQGNASQAGGTVSNLHGIQAAYKSRDPQLPQPPTAPSSSNEDQPVSSEVSSSIPSINKISSSGSPERRQDACSAEELTAAAISDIPLDMIPLPSGKRPSPKKATSPTSLSGKTSFAGKKRRSPVPQIPKSTSPDSEVSSLMTNESLPQSPSISSSVSKTGAAVLEGQAPVLVDSNPCSARSPIPVAPSSMLQPHSGVSLPSFGSVFSLTKDGEPVTSEDSIVKNR